MGFTMKKIYAACFVCFFGSPLLAQDADPFGGSDPFGGGSDPFGEVFRADDKAKVVPKAIRKPRRSTRLHQTDVKPASRVAEKREDIDSEARIRAALLDETTHIFIDTPLQDAVAAISQTHDIPILIDRRALEEFGITPDTPVSIDLKNVSLRSFMRLMLRDLELTYIVKDEVMQLTTIEKAEKNLVVRMHPFPKTLVDKSDQVLKALQGSVSPSAWEAVGGPASAHVVENIIAVSATEHIHEEVTEFLLKLATAYEAHQKKEK